MAKNIYIGVNNVSRKVKKMYIGVNGVARKVKKGYIGVNGVARQFYSSRLGYAAPYSIGDSSLSNLISFGAIGDKAVAFNRTNYANSVTFTTISDNLSVNTFEAVTGYSIHMGDFTDSIFNNDLVAVIKNTSRYEYQILRLNSSLTSQLFPISNLKIGQNMCDINVFNNNLFIIGGYDDDDDRFHDTSAKFDSSMTMQTLRISNTQLPTNLGTAYFQTQNVAGSAVTASYLHLVFPERTASICSIDSSLTTHGIQYFNGDYQDEDNDGISLQASYEGYGLFGLGTRRYTSSSGNISYERSTGMTTISNNLTINHMTNPWSLKTRVNPLAQNKIFDGVLYIGTSPTKYGGNEYSYWVKMSSGLVCEIDSTFLNSYYNLGGTNRPTVRMDYAMPTGLYNPSFMVCTMYDSVYTSYEPCFIYQG